MQTMLHHQSSPYASPWPLRVRLKLLAWEYCWLLFCAWTPKPLNPWRLFWLRAFGARVSGRPFVHQRARVAMPWNLELRDRACLGDRASAYSLGPIRIEEDATVAQEVYLCAGTHDFSQPSRPLQTAAIVIGPRAFVGARAFVLPGVSVGADAIVGACSVVTHDVAPRTVCAGNPCKLIRQRPRFP